MQGDDGINTGAGFVYFSTPLEADLAAHSFNGQILRRQEFLQSQYAQRIGGFTRVNPLYYPAHLYPAGRQLMYPQFMGMRPTWRGYRHPTMVRPPFLAPLNMILHPRSTPVRQISAIPPGPYRAMKHGEWESPEMLSNMLASATLEEQKQIIGDRLYPLVRKFKADFAEKITGMLLEMKNEDLLVLLESPEELQKKVEEAFEVLEMSKRDGASSSGSNVVVVGGGGVARN